MIMCLLDDDDESGLHNDELLQPLTTHFRIDFFEMQKFVTCLNSLVSYKTTTRELPLIQQGLQQIESNTIRLFSHFPMRTVIIN